MNLDDCWQVDRDAEGAIVVDAQRFPSGMGALADAIHALDLKIGTYTRASTLTCQLRSGSFGHERIDAATYATWGIVIGGKGLSAEESQTHMGLWALVAAPLIAGNDVRAMPDEVRGMLTHPEVIAIDQDPWGVAAVRIPVSAKTEI